MEVLETTNVGSATTADPTILTEDTANSLKAMLGSRDEADHKMAQLILNQVNVEKSIYWIWELAKGGRPEKMVNLRTKASRQFRDSCDLFYIAYSGADVFSKWLMDKGWMTPEIYERLVMSLIKNIAYKLNGMAAAKTFEFSINIKEEYKHLKPDFVPGNLIDICNKS